MSTSSFWSIFCIFAALYLSKYAIAASPNSEIVHLDTACVDQEIKSGYANITGNHLKAEVIIDGQPRFVVFERDMASPPSPKTPIYRVNVKVKNSADAMKVYSFFASIYNRGSGRTLDPPNVFDTTGKLSSFYFEDPGQWNWSAKEDISNIETGILEATLYDPSLGPPPKTERAWELLGIDSESFLLNIYFHLGRWEEVRAAELLRGLVQSPCALILTAASLSTLRR